MCCSDDPGDNDPISDSTPPVDEQTEDDAPQTSSHTAKPTKASTSSAAASKKRPATPSATAQPDGNARPPLGTLSVQAKNKTTPSDASKPTAETAGKTVTKAASKPRSITAFFGASTGAKPASSLLTKKRPVPAEDPVVVDPIGQAHDDTAAGSSSPCEDNAANDPQAVLCSAPLWPECSTMRHPCQEEPHSSLYSGWQCSVDGSEAVLGLGIRTHVCGQEGPLSTEDYDVCEGLLNQEEYADGCVGAEAFGIRCAGADMDWEYEDRELCAGSDENDGSATLQERWSGSHPVYTGTVEDVMGGSPGQLASLMSPVRPRRRAFAARVLPGAPLDSSSIMFGSLSGDLEVSPPDALSCVISSPPICRNASHVIYNSCQTFIAVCSGIRIKYVLCMANSLSVACVIEIFVGLDFQERTHDIMGKRKRNVGQIYWKNTALADYLVLGCMDSISTD